MARRGGPPDTLSLFNVPPKAAQSPPVVLPRPEPEKPEAPPEDLPELPKLRLVPALATAEDEVIVEKVGDDRYLVTNVRQSGTTCAGVYYTKRQLGMLLRRIGGALEIE